MTVVRELPSIGALETIASISVSEAEQLLSCSLRVALNNDRRLRELRPVVTSALLGTAAHNALASMARAADDENRATDRSATRQVAQEAFDAAVRALCEKRDIQIAARGPLPGESADLPNDLPFYAKTRARFVRFARQRFGDDWLWKIPRSPTRVGGSHARGAPQTIGEGVHSEIPLHSSDGRLSGIADSIVVLPDRTVVEEFKTGELTPERIPGWTLQLVLYGHLYAQQYGVHPSTLRILSIAGAMHEVAYDQRTADAEVERVGNALSKLNDGIAAGLRAQDLASPAEGTCSHCSHRAWCEAYWTSPVPALAGTDLDGIVAKTDGWKVFLLRSNGTTTVVDFRWYGCLPGQGQHVRVCNARVGQDQTLLADRGTSVWSLRS